MTPAQPEAPKPPDILALIRCENGPDGMRGVLDAYGSIDARDVRELLDLLVKAGDTIRSLEARIANYEKKDQNENC